MSFADHLTNSHQRRLYEYWQEHCPDGRLPARDGLDPTQIPSVLRYLILADVEDGGARLRFRLVGTDTAQFWRDHLTGQKGTGDGLQRAELVQIAFKSPKLQSPTV